MIQGDKRKCETNTPKHSKANNKRQRTKQKMNTQNKIELLKQLGLLKLNKREEEHIKKYGCCSCCLNEDLTEIKTIKVIGYSVGDASVGIGEIPFEIDTGLTELNDSDREFIADTMIRAIYELHDNGTIRFYFSDENTGDFDYSNVFGYNEFRATNESVKQTRQNIVRRTTNAKGQNKK